MIMVIIWIIQELYLCIEFFLFYQKEKLKKEDLIMRRLFTSESVTEGHPDKLCDYISDSILDSYFAKDP